MLQDLELDIRQDQSGNKYLYFPFLTISDVHLGTRHCRAKRLSHMLEHIMMKDFGLIGDIVDGEHMLCKKRWKFGQSQHSWHRQVIAHICRKAAEGVAVTYIDGNHDEDICGQKVAGDSKNRLRRNLRGKTIYGINIAEEEIYIDPLGRRFKLRHGHQYDPTAGKCGTLGNFALEVMHYINNGFQHIPKCSHISLAAKGKKALKKTIDRIWSIRKRIAEDVDQDTSLHGIITGHSHISEISRTPEGKFLLNDGCCTEHVEALVQDRNGTFAILEWHMTHVKITQEGNYTRIIAWKDVGLDSFHNQPQLIEDASTAKADRLLRLSYRMWPPKDRLTIKNMRAFLRAGNEVNERTYKIDHMPLLLYRMCPPLERRRVSTVRELLHAARHTTAYTPISHPGRNARLPPAVTSSFSTPKQPFAA